jgi:hypothetical protein
MRPKVRMEQDESGALAWIELDDEGGHVKLTRAELAGMLKVRASASIYQKYLDERSGDQVTEAELAGAMTFLERLGVRQIALTVAREHRHAETVRRASAMPTGLDEPLLLQAVKELAGVMEATRNHATPDTPALVQAAVGIAGMQIQDRLHRATPDHLAQLLNATLETLSRDGAREYRERAGLPPAEIILRPQPISVDAMDLGRLKQTGEEVPRG